MVRSQRKSNAEILWLAGSWHSFFLPHYCLLLTAYCSHRLLLVLPGLACELIKLCMVAVSL